MPIFVGFLKADEPRRNLNIEIFKSPVSAISPPRRCVFCWGFEDHPEISAGLDTLLAAFATL
jgi:uncharacterized protein YndB with AHSA1/START domain